MTDRERTLWAVLGAPPGMGLLRRPPLVPGPTCGTSSWPRSGPLAPPPENSGAFLALARLGPPHAERA